MVMILAAGSQEKNPVFERKTEWFLFGF